MDHEVEHTADIGAAARVRPVPFGFDEFRHDRPAGEFFEGRIEAFDVAHLQRNAIPGGNPDQFVRFGDRPADRLFDHRRNAGPQERGGDGKVIDGRRDDGDGIDVIDQAFVIVVGRGADGRGDFRRLLAVGIDDADEVHVRHAGQDSRMVPAEMPDTDHCHPHPRHAVPGFLSGAESIPLRRPDDSNFGSRRFDRHFDPVVAFRAAFPFGRQSAGEIDV